MMNFYKIATLLMLLSLMACEQSVNFADLCEQNPEICQEFEEDSWCKRERIQVGFANLSQKIANKEEHQYKQLIAYEGYAKCMEHASKIEHIKLKVKKTMRINNLIKAQAKIKAISLATRSSNHPDLLFFHWSRYLNDNALERFLAYEGTEQLEIPSAQVNLATYYIKIDPNKTLNLLYHALELYQRGEPIDTEIFKSLSSIFSDKGEYKQAYIWSKILHLYDPFDKNINDATLQDYVDTFKLDVEFLDKVVNSTLSSIKAGSFKSPSRK